MRYAGAMVDDAVTAALLLQNPALAAKHLSAAADEAWIDAFRHALDEAAAPVPPAMRALDRLRDLWGLTQGDLGAVFGVSRQAVAKWARRGVPEAARVRLADLDATNDLLTHHLKHDRIPAVVRRSAARLGGRSMLDVATAGQTSELLRYTREMLDLARATA